MPRNPGTGIYTKPYPDVISDTTIESTVHNGEIADIETDLNTPRPIVAGGTGANSAAQARDNLDAEVASQTVTNFDSHPWEAGSFQADGTATNAPVGGVATGGIALMYPANPTYMTIIARLVGDTFSPARQYTRDRVAGVWQPWVLFGSDKVAKTGDVMSGDLVIAKATPGLALRKTASGQQANIYGALNTAFRWAVTVGNTTAEVGSNTGSDFDISRFDDAGTLLTPPALSINRASGNISAPGSITSAAFVFSNGSGMLPSGTTVFIRSDDVFIQNNAASTNYASFQAAGISLLKPTTVSATLTVTGGSILCNSGRIMSRVTANSSVGCYNGGAMAAGMWVDDTNMYLGSMTDLGVPSTFWMLLRSNAMQISASTAYKPGGGTWTDSSDARIKNVLGNYDNGLDAILQLQPVRFTYKGNETPPDQPPSNFAVPQYEADGKTLKQSKEAVAVPYPNSPHHEAANSGKEFVGLIAQAAEIVMPELVTQRAAMIDGQPVTDMRDLDTGPLIFALVNSIKALNARIEALEAAQAPP